MNNARLLKQLLRPKQIHRSHLTANDGTQKEVASNRLPELMDVLEEIEDKAVLWAHWQRDVHRIIRVLSKKFGDDRFVDYSSLPLMSERQKNIEKLQDPYPPYEFCVGSTETGS